MADPRSGTLATASAAAFSAAARAFEPAAARDARPGGIRAQDRVPQQPLRALGPGPEVRIDGEQDRAARADRLVDERGRAGQRVDPDRQARSGVVRRSRRRERRDR